MESKHRPIYLVKDTNINDEASVNKKEEQIADTTKHNKSNKNEKASTDKKAIEEKAQKNEQPTENNTDKEVEEEPEKVEYDLSYFE